MKASRIVCAWTAATLLSAAGAGGLSAQDLKTARDLLDRGEPAAALAALDEDFSGSADSHFLAAKALDALDQPTRAAEEAQQAVDLEPDNAAYRLQLGQIYLTRNNPAAAREIFSEALDRFPENVYLRLGRGLALNQLRRHREAQLDLETCLEQAPSLGLALDAVMEAYLQTAQYKEALGAAEAFREKNPEDYRGYYHAAAAKERLRAPPEEIEALLGQALSRNGRYAPAHTLLGKNLLELGRTQEAILSLEAAVRLQPDYPLARIQLARAYRKGKRLKDAAAETKIVKELERRRNEPVPSLRRPGED